MLCSLFVRCAESKMMQSAEQSEHEADPLLLFTPVPLARVRARGWSAERQIAFIDALARTGVVRFAAASVGMSARSAYQLRDRAAWDHPFAQAWDEAMDRARDAAAGLALKSLVDPQKVPIIRRGRIIGWQEERFDARLALAALRVSSSAVGPPVPHAQRRWDKQRRRDMAEMQAREAARAAAPPPPPPAPPPPPEPAPEEEQALALHPRTGRPLRHGDIVSVYIPPRVTWI
jgi:hypothetical protein